MEELRQIQEMFENAMLYVCVAALVCISVGAFLYATRGYVGPVLDRIRRMSPFEQVFIAIMVGGMCLYGGSKGIHYDGGIRENQSSPSLITNSTVRITWERVPGAVLPLDSPVYIDYRLKGSTDEWGLLGQATVRDGIFETTLANAEDYEFNVWAYYIPPEPVHTNGVWSFSTMRDRKNENILPLRTMIKADVEILSPPNLKGKQ